MVRLVNLLAAGVLVFTISGNLWIYFQATQDLRTQTQLGVGLGFGRARTEEAVSTLFNQLDTWAHNLSMATLFGLAGLIFVGGIFFSIWRRAIMRRAIQAIQHSEELSLQLESSRMSLQRHQSERAKYDGEIRYAYDEMEKRIEERTSGLTRTCAALERELNSRRQAE
jgi:C4-dicarboxylate-specific signal transduction histidine kinase